jgi:hypothetical protein
MNGNSLNVLVDWLTDLQSKQLQWLQATLKTLDILNETNPMVQDFP